MMESTLSSQVALSSSPAAPAPSLKTWQLFVLVTAASLLLSWVMNEFVMTREVYHTVMGEQLDARRIDEYLDLSRRYAIWGYLATPLVLLVRIGFVALLLQTTLLVTLAEVRFMDLFRAGTTAFSAMLYGTAIHTGWLLWLGEAEITKTTLSIRPGALSNFMGSHRSRRSSCCSTW